MFKYLTKRYYTLFILCAVFLGCAKPGPILIDNIKYEPRDGLSVGRPKAVIGVSPFDDQRGVAASFIGKRRIPGASLENDLVVQGRVADVVYGAFRQALSERGFTLKDLASSDISAESLKPESGDIVIAGEIKALGLDIESRPFNVSYRAYVQLRVVLADTTQKKVIRTLNLSSRLEREDISFSFSIAEKMLSEALSSAIDQMFKDEEVGKRFQ